MRISDQFEQRITTQSYGPKPFIDGVEIVPLSFQNDDSGNFCELFRLHGGHIEGLQKPFEAKQMSMSVMVPNTIKAYHLHKHQEDLWYVVPSDRVLVNLHDLREDSPTYDYHMRLVLGGGKNLLLRIPSGVAHGAANVYERNMTILYATSEQFSPHHPDEHRLPWDLFGTDKWEITKG